MPDAISQASSSSTPASEKESAVFDANLLVFFEVLDYTGLLPELHRVLVPRLWSRSSSRYPESSAVVYRQRNESNSGPPEPKPCEGMKVR